MFLYQYTQHEEQTRAAQRFDSVPEIWYHWLNETWWLECPVGQLQALQETYTGQKRQGVASHVTERLECTGLTAGNGTVESFWTGIRDKQCECHCLLPPRPPSQDNDTTKLFFKEWRDASKSNGLSLWVTSACQKPTGSITLQVQPGSEDS